MVAQTKYYVVTLGAVVLLTLGSAGCIATRKYVQTQAVQPLQGQIQTVDKKVDKVDAKTTELDQHITDVDRHAEEGYSTANANAKTADQHAQDAAQQAQGAQQTANKGVDTANKAETEINNIDNYQPVKTESVLFGLNRSELSDDDQQQLSALTETLSSLKHYTIEVEGFTDSTGPKQYNLQLSQRRADAVVRYLTENDHVPLVRIHVLGFGEDEPVANNHTRDGRKENRRVDVKIMTPELNGQSQTQTSNLPATQ
jgi:outer membrane protein OmpA-like peptidoglycan-associated protein